MAWLNRIFGKKKAGPAGFQHIDFTTTFPFINWVSEWGYCPAATVAAVSFARPVWDGWRTQVRTQRVQPWAAL
jgi:hypothetical protein